MSIRLSSLEFNNESEKLWNIHVILDGSTLKYSKKETRKNKIRQMKFYSFERNCENFNFSNLELFSLELML